MQYYKVVNNIKSAVTIDTNKINYSLTLVDKDFYSDFLNFIINSSNDLDLPLDFYITLNNNVALWGDVYFQNIPKSTNRIFEVSILTHKQHHNNIYIKEDDLIRIADSLDEIGYEVFGEGFYLWESVYEKVRQKKYKDKPARENSFFLFDNIKDCQYYIDKHKGDGVICKVEILNNKSIFKGDMNLWDTISDNFTFKEAEEHVDKYWLGKTSNKPVFEYLFQGTCILKPL